MYAAPSRFDVAAVRRRLDDPTRVARLLGLLDGSKRQPDGGRFIRCPAHGDRTASCSLTRGPDGTLRARCFACGWTGDVVGLVGACRGTAGDFKASLAAAAELAGVDAEDVEGWARPSANRQDHLDGPRYAPAAEVSAGWAACGRLMDRHEANPANPDVATLDELAAALHARLEPETGTGELVHPAAVAYLRGRALKPAIVDDFDLLRVLPRGGAALPAWARGWHPDGYRLVSRVYDTTGEARGLRAWRMDDRQPKRKAPAGFAVAGLVLADLGGVAMLAGAWVPDRVVVAEGEPDFLTWATRVSDADETPFAVLALTGAGSWTQSIADRIPRGARVDIWTDNDAPGEKYAVEIASSLRGRCPLTRARA